MTMSEGLFRQEALAYSITSKYGNPMFYQPFTLKLLFVVLTGSFILLVVLGASVKLKDTEIVRGQLVPAAGMVKVYSARSGIVDQIHVKNGELVRKGQVLAIISVGHFGDLGIAIGEQKLKQVGIQVAELENQISLEEAKFNLRKQALAERLSGLDLELSLVNRRIELLEEQLSIASEEFDKLKTLSAGNMVSKTEYNQKKAAQINVENSLTGVLLERQNIYNLREDLLQKQKTLPLEHKDTLGNLRQHLSQLENHRLDTNSQNILSVVASADGVVTNFDIAAGDFVAHSTPLLSILPKDYRVEAELYMPSRALGLLNEGQNVLISYDAYPYQTYGSSPAKSFQYPNPYRTRGSF
jgi:membrane fusion protein